ncbi:hypothetical protein [Buchananella felis]|uniref:hypothetical protein n=1 Tax=Buchananella felis TaxID=3231492 RepID=UPI003527ABF2
MLKRLRLSFSSFSGWLIWLMLLISTATVGTSGVLWLTVGRRGDASSPWWETWNWFNVGGEYNLSSWWAASQWIILAVAAVFVAFLSRRFWFMWLLIAAVALYGSADEATEIHEEFWSYGDAITPYLAYDFFSYRWAVFGSVVVIAVPVLLAPLLYRLPLDVLKRLVIAGLVFVGGAVGVETLSGHLDPILGPMTSKMLAIIHIEEYLELLGVIAAVWAVLSMCEWKRTETGLQVRCREYRGEAETGPGCRTVTRTR